MDKRCPSAGPERIPSLDGLRALAISLVCANHCINAFGPLSPPVFLRTAELGDLGVRIFFVLSGFLITILLWQEVDRSGSINLARFYFRRCLRIFPAFYFLVLGVAIGGSLGLWRYDHLLNAVTYTADYREPGWTLGHSWSLAVEEQFYLFWPVLLLALGRRRAVIGAALCLLICPPLRTGLFLFVERSYLLLHQFEAQADALATGCLLAAVSAWLARQPRYTAIRDRRAFACVPLAVLAAAEIQVLEPFPHASPISTLAGFTVMNVGIALCIDWTIRHPSGTTGRILNAPVVVWVGVLSYSIYLWQELIFMPPSARLVASAWLPALIGLCGIFVSYYLVEAPFLTLRRRMDSLLFGPEHRMVCQETPAIELPVTEPG